MWPLLTGQVLALEPEVEGHSQMATVRLQRSDQTVSVRCKDLGERWEAGAASGAAASGRAATPQDSRRNDLKSEKKREKEAKRDRSDRDASEKSKVHNNMVVTLSF